MALTSRRPPSSDAEGFRTIHPPFGRKELAPPGTQLQVIQFQTLPDDPSLERLAAFIDEYSHLSLRAFAGYDGSFKDLEFLRFFARAKRVSVDLRYHPLASTSGLAYLGEDLEELNLGGTRRRLDLAPLARFKRLRLLGLDGHTENIDVLSELTTLEDLTLRSITLPDLSLLRPLDQLRSLDIKLGGTHDLHPLPDIGQIEYLELWMVRGLSDLTPVSGMKHLQHLFLQALKNVTALPDLSGNPRLERVSIDGLKQLFDLRPLRTAPALRHLLLVDMPQLRWEQLEVLADHPTLQGFRVGTGSVKRNNEYEARLGYPEPPPRAG